MGVDYDKHTIQYYLFLSISHLSFVLIPQWPFPGVLVHQARSENTDDTTLSATSVSSKMLILLTTKENKEEGALYSPAYLYKLSFVVSYLSNWGKVSLWRMFEGTEVSHCKLYSTSTVPQPTNPFSKWTGDTSSRKQNTGFLNATKHLCLSLKRNFCIPLSSGDLTAMSYWIKKKKYTDKFCVPVWQQNRDTSQILREAGGSQGCSDIQAGYTNQGRDGDILPQAQ